MTEQWSLCRNGDEFSFKNRKGVNERKIYIVDGKTIFAFVPKNKGFHECPSFVEVTSQVLCEVTKPLHFLMEITCLS